MEHAVCHELVDPFAGQEGGIQLDDRLRPEQTGVELVLYELVNATVADRDEAARVVGVVGNKPFSQVEDFYVCLSFLVRFEEPVTAKVAANDLDLREIIVLSRRSYVHRRGFRSPDGLRPTVSD
jgi:hypothetical protein